MATRLVATFYTQLYICISGTYKAIHFKASTALETVGTIVVLTYFARH